MCRSFWSLVESFLFASGNSRATSMCSSWDFLINSEQGFFSMIFSIFPRVAHTFLRSHLQSISGWNKKHSQKYTRQLKTVKKEEETSGEKITRRTSRIESQTTTEIWVAWRRSHVWKSWRRNRLLGALYSAQNVINWTWASRKKIV